MRRAGPSKTYLVGGKNLFVQFSDFSIKLHFLMFGSYRINEQREGMAPRLSLTLDTGALDFYNRSVRLVGNDEVDMLFPKEVDITSQRWNLRKVMSLTRQVQDKLVCDVLLDQSIFAGVGNIIKNEALSMARIHPLSVLGQIPDENLKGVVLKTREFSMRFCDVKKRGEELASYLSIYQKRKCPWCRGKIIVKKTGERQRKSHFCPSCQVLYGRYE